MESTMGIAMTSLIAERWHAAMKHMASGAQKPASPEALDCTNQPCTADAPFSGPALGAKPQERYMQLLYDSFAQPATAGTRSAGMRVRHMLYRAEPYQIDLQVEAHADGNRVIVTGQLIDVGHPDLVHPGVQVTLSDGRENIVRTLTNQFGEFRGEVNLSGHLELTFLDRDERPIVVILRGVLDASWKATN